MFEMKIELLLKIVDQLNSINPNKGNISPQSNKSNADLIIAVNIDVTLI